MEGTYGRLRWVIPRISDDGSPPAGVIDVDREGIHVARMGVTWLRLYGSPDNDLVSTTGRTYPLWSSRERSELLDCLAYVRVLVIRQRERAGEGGRGREGRKPCR